MPPVPPVPLDLDLALRQDRRLRALARSIAGPNLADDAVQDAWLAALRNRPRDRSAAAAWLARIAERCARMARRAEGRRRRHEAATARHHATGDHTAETVARLEAQRAVTQALLGLAEPYRTAVLLRYDHELDAGEIARRTGTSAANARQRIHRGLALLRERLAHDLGPDWRRQRGLALLIGPVSAAGLSCAPPAFLGVLAMTKLRLGAIAVLVLGAGLLYWQTTRAGPADTPPQERPAPGPVASTPHDPEPAALAAPSAERRAVEATERATPASDRWLGRVLDLAGQPLGGVAIHVVSGEDGVLGEPSTTTAEDGSFALPRRETLSLLDTGPPWVAVHTQRLLSTPERELLLVAARAVDLGGTVRDPNGMPLEGVAVSFERISLVDFPESLDTTIRPDRWPEITTGKDGHFAFRRLPSGAARLVFRKPGYGTEARAIEPQSNPDLPVALTPLRGGTRLLAGTVWDHGGALIANARVGLGDREVRSDAAGHYQLAFPPGSHIYPDAALWAAAAGQTTAVEPAFGARLAALAGDASLEHDLRLGEPVQSLRGVVLGPDGKPYAGASVFPWDEPVLAGYLTAVDAAIADDVEPLELSGPSLRAWSRTDAEGRFALTGFADRAYRLRVLDLRAGWAWTTEPIAAGQDDLVVRLPEDLIRAEVSGRVITADGTPAGSMRIQRMVCTYVGGGAVHHSGVDRATTDAEGRFALHRVPRYGAKLTFEGEGFEGVALELDPPQPSTGLEIVVPRRCQFRVHLHDPELAAGWISLLDAGGKRLLIHQRLFSVASASTDFELREGKSGVLETNDLAATLVARAGERELRIPLRLQPGEITVVTQ